jgi:hypothetical protein
MFEIKREINVWLFFLAKVADGTTMNPDVHQSCDKKKVEFSAAAGNHRVEIWTDEVFIES